MTFFTESYPVSIEHGACRQILIQAAGLDHIPKFPSLRCRCIFSNEIESVVDRLSPHVYYSHLTLTRISSCFLLERTRWAGSTERSLFRSVGIDFERPPLVILISRRRREKILVMSKVAATLENRAEGAKKNQTLKDPPLVISVKIKLGGLSKSISTDIFGRKIPWSVI